MQIQKLKPDADKQTNGVWITYDGEAQFLIAYMDDTNYDAKVKRMSLAARRKSRTRGLPAALEIEVQVKSMVGTLLRDWKGLDDGVDENGKDIPFPYTVENANRLLTESKDVRDFLQIECSILANFQRDESEEGEGEDEPKADLKSDAPLVPQVGGASVLPTG